jgi:hypothetical protein
VHELPEKEFNNIDVITDFHNPTAMFCEVHRIVAYIFVPKINCERIPMLFPCVVRMGV